MTATEYKTRREELGLTQFSLAVNLGIARETVARRETEAAPISTEAALAMIALARKLNPR